MFRKQKQLKRRDVAFRNMACTCSGVQPVQGDSAGDDGSQLVKATEAGGSHVCGALCHHVDSRKAQDFVLIGIFPNPDIQPVWSGMPEAFLCVG